MAMNNQGIMYLCIHLTHNYLVRAYYVPDAILDTSATSVNEAKIFALTVRSV